MDVSTSNKMGNPVKFEIQSSENDSYFWKFDLNSSIIWSKDFREALMNKVPFEALSVFKCGEGKKWIEGGLLKTKNFISPNTGIQLMDSLLSMSQISFQTYQKLKKTTQNKVFFKGFPYFASKAEVKAVFERFGNVSYVYFMCEARNGKNPYKMGYLIFANYNSVDDLLEYGLPLKYFNFLISYEEYHSNKKAPKTSNLTGDRGLGINKGLFGQFKSQMEEENLRKHVLPGKNVMKFNNNVKQGDQRLATPFSNCYKGKSLTQLWLASSAKVAANASNPSNLRINICVRSSNDTERRVLLKRRLQENHRLSQ